MERPKILVCGGRNFTNWPLLRDTLDKICWDRQWIFKQDEVGNWMPDIIIIEGGARGADQFAGDYADLNWTGHLIFNADWDKYGKRAGPIRNQQMLDEGKPDLIVAFPSKDSHGTYDMIRRAKKANVEVIVIS